MLTGALGMNRLFIFFIVMLFAFGCDLLDKEKSVKWPPRTGKHDNETRTLSKEAKVSCRISQNDPIQYSGSKTLSPTVSGLMLPNDDFKINGGTIISKLGDIEKTAKVTDWDFVYEDASLKNKINWGPCLTKGELILPLSLFENPPYKMYVNNFFEAEDYGEKHILIRLDATKNHRLFMVDQELTVGWVGTKISLNDKIIERHKDGWYYGKQKIFDCPGESAYKWAKEKNTTEAYETYLNEFPNSKYSEQAKAELNKIRQSHDRFKQAQEQNTIEAYKKFLIDFPNSIYSDKAKDALENLGITYRDFRFQHAIEQNTIQAYEDFLRDYPNTYPITQYLEKLYFEQAKEQNTIQAYEDFLKKYPYGYEYTDPAKDNLKKLRETAP
jgi:hypothetical protein